MTRRNATQRTAQSLTYEFWLVFDINGNMRMTRNEPGTDRNERAMRLKATLPLSLWREPRLQGNITVTETPEGHRTEIDIRAAGDALKAALGVDIDLKAMR